jgi:hypothetical protein
MARRSAADSIRCGSRDAMGSPIPCFRHPEKGRDVRRSSASRGAGGASAGRG